MTYDELLLELEGWGMASDLTAQFPRWIQSAEARHKRDIRVRAMVKRSVFDSSTATGRYLPLPVDFLEMQTLLVNDSVPYALKMVSLETMNRSNAGERPRQFAVFDDQFETNRPTTIDLHMYYWAPFPALGPTVQENWLSTNYPDAYLAPCLVRLFKYNDDDDEAEKHELLYQQEVRDIRMQDNRSRRKGSQMRPDVPYTP